MQIKVRHKKLGNDYESYIDGEQLVELTDGEMWKFENIEIVKDELPVTICPLDTKGSDKKCKHGFVNTDISHCGDCILETEDKKECPNICKVCGETYPSDWKPRTHDAICEGSEKNE